MPLVKHTGDKGTFSVASADDADPYTVDIMANDVALLLLIAGHALSAGAALVVALLFHLNGDNTPA
jgi:hypothetical protein